MPNEVRRPLRLYVTHVDGEGYFLRVSGQLDQQSSLMVESLFQSARENLENGVGTASAAAIHEGLICAAKYKDGTYYRAKIINTTNLATGLIGVHFIDYGNKDIISLSTIRILDSYDSMFLQLRGQATDYYLSGIIHPSGRWDEALLLRLQSLLCYAEYPVVVEAQTRSLPIISVQFKGNDLSTHLIQNRFGVNLPLDKQEAHIQQLVETQSLPHWQSSFLTDTPTYPEHVPFLVNQNFPTNPASAMRLQQNVSLPPYNGVTPPSIVSQRLIVNRAPRNPVNLKAPARQPQHAQVTSPVALTHSSSVSKTLSPKKSTTYKSRLLEVNTQHKVCVSFAEEGPELFAVQLITDSSRFEAMMDDINRRPHSSLTEPPMIGTVCLGRMSGDRIICRAIVMNLSGSQCKLFFVDFGDTEMVSYYDIFDIPEEFVKPNVFAMRFCLSGVKKLEKGLHLNEAFKQLVNGKVLTLKVVTPEGPPLIQYGELYLDNKNVLDLLLANMKDKLQFKSVEMLTLGIQSSVLVSYVDSCIKFFIQLSDNIDQLNAVMDAVKVHCENTSSPEELPVGAACCARFPDDGSWYRAHIKDTKGNGKVVVTYVDYGNEQEVDVSDLRTITPELIQLPAQALKCALKGFEDKPVETKTSNQLEMLALEKTFMAYVVGMLSNDTMLVTLVDDAVSPPLDVARRMTQLSQPRSGHAESKVTTPSKKEASESFSSPETSPDDSRKKSFRREKSFKDDRRTHKEGNDEFPQRGGSFRNRDNRDTFDRSGAGRNSDKFGGRPERGDRRGGPKPWEANSPPASQTNTISAADDSWDETPSQTTPAFTAPPNRDRPNRDNNRDRRKPRPDQASRPGWKNKEGGVGKRFNQHVEATPPEQQSENRSASIQDRLKRDNKFNSNNDYNDRSKNLENRPDRREYRGDKENWGDRKDKWGDKKDNFQKREFRDNKGERPPRGERGDRTKSNFNPRDRAERSFGSESDKRSERSFNGQDSGRDRDRASSYQPRNYGQDGGRDRDRAPHHARNKYTQEQLKELSDPVPLDTPFEEPSIELGAQHETAVTWIISPENFYTQILSLQPKFLDMMHKIPELYKGVKSYSGEIAVGNSVLARYPADGVLYRATIVTIQPFSKLIVRYVDFGNKQLVDTKDIWQLDRQLLELPKMAVHCSLLGVAPKDGEWKSDPEIDLCFNAPRYQCIFQDFAEELFKVSLWNNGVSVADMLIEKQLASLSEQQSSATLKDEAIDLTIIIGQQILCRVTHVESFEKFYVQLDLDKAALVENAIAGFDNSLLTPLAADSLSDGIHCTVKHEDKVYRAILNDVADVNNIQATLPDYGKNITTSLDNLMILPTELSVYYYQSLECCLNNYNETAKTLINLEELKKLLTGNKFIIYINDVDGISLVTTLYEAESGQKVSIFEPDEGAYDEVVPLCMRSVFNYNFGMAYIAHTENLNEIYLQRSSDSDKIAQLLDDLYKFYGEGTPEVLTFFEADSLCAANSTDGNWYRATILSSTETEVKVQYTDYGNSETISKESLKKLDPRFYEPCAFALVVSLGLVSLQEDALTKLNEWTSEKEVQVTLSFGNDGWLANLHLDGVDLSIQLVNEKLATPKISSDEDQKQESAVQEPISLPEGCTQVYISHIDTPGQFWLQMADKIDQIDEIQAELQANISTYPEIDKRDMGTLCIAKYTADDQWYRAQILDSDSDITTVRFIDYGNTDVLDNQPELLKAMPEHLKDIEGYAVKSSVNAVPTGTGQWSEPSSDFFSSLCGDLSSPLDAIIVLKDVTTYVDVFINGQNLTDKLVDEGHATRSEEPECGDLPSCFASHVNSPSEFWIQLETATPELQAMENAMVDAENFPELTDKEEGVLCAAKYPEDGAWYRAQVIVDGSEGTEVLFMDYGNASITTELRSLPDELQIKPALSRKCALQKPRDIKSWSRKSEVKFNELAAEGATIFNIQFIASGDISIVELYLEGKSVTEELVGLCEEHLSERPTPVGLESRANGRISYVVSTDEFYVHLDESEEELDKVTNKMLATTEYDAIPELKVGTICATMWVEDELWYRGKIVECNNDGYLVLFIDHGNKTNCEASQIKKLPEELSGISPIAKCCRLTGLDGATDEIKDNISAYLASDNTSTFQIEFIDSSKEISLVKLVLDGEDICSKYLNETIQKEVSMDVQSEIKTNVDDQTQNEIDTNTVGVNSPECDVEEFRAAESDSKSDSDLTTAIVTSTIDTNNDFRDTESPNTKELVENSIVEDIKNDLQDVDKLGSITETNEGDVKAIENTEIVKEVLNDLITNAVIKKENEEDNHDDLNNSSQDVNDSLDSVNTVNEIKSVAAEENVFDETSSITDKNNLPNTKTFDEKDSMGTLQIE